MRLVPDEPLPPYSYVTGHFPHPIRDPAGHMYGRPEAPLDRPDPENWRECTPYLYGIDLFNHGYYWEAHEVWEALWHACGRKGTAADFFKALIKLAAAGVKARERRQAGVARHAARAVELLRCLAGDKSQPRQMGLTLTEVIEYGESLVNDPPISGKKTPPPVERLVGFELNPK